MNYCCKAYDWGWMVARHSQSHNTNCPGRSWPSLQRDTVKLSSQLTPTSRPWESLNWNWSPRSLSGLLCRPSLSWLDPFLVKASKFQYSTLLLVYLCVYELITGYNLILSLSPCDPDFVTAASPQSEHLEPQDLRSSSRSHY
jgi:hypothetical protein